ncbi:hypothetical protein BDR07DRAFT_1377922 [Suillus spraguei]|nr:hypothetical protein BDR07DRAFT_1377922 [Suillus spraguei]
MSWFDHFLSVKESHSKEIETVMNCYGRPFKGTLEVRVDMSTTILRMSSPLTANETIFQVALFATQCNIPHVIDQDLERENKASEFCIDTTNLNVNDEFDAKFDATLEYEAKEKDAELCAANQVVDHLGKQVYVR